MRPGTHHFVITIEHCLALGGHFYNKDNFFTSLRTLVYEHYFGKWVTNTVHPSSPIMLFKTLSGYRKIFEDENGDLVASESTSISQSNTQLSFC